MGEIGVITEQGDLGLGYDELSEEDIAKVKTNVEKDTEITAEE